MPPHLDDADQRDRIRTPIGEAWVDGGVLWHHIHPETLVSPEAAEATVQALEGFVGDKVLPAVVDIRDVHFADREARDIFAREMTHERATAIIVSGKVSKALGNAYLRVSRPARPTRMFTSKKDAAIWARSFLD